MKQIVRALQVLQEGPATSQDLADETGWSRKTAASVLSVLEADGLVIRRWIPADGSQYSRPQGLYALPEHVC